MRQLRLRGRLKEKVKNNISFMCCSLFIITFQGSVSIMRNGKIELAKSSMKLNIKEYINIVKLKLGIRKAKNKTVEGLVDLIYNAIRKGDKIEFNDPVHLWHLEQGNKYYDGDKRFVLS